MKFFNNAIPRPSPIKKSPQTLSGSSKHNIQIDASPQTLHDFNNKISDAINKKATTFTLSITEANSLFVIINDFILEQKNLQDNIFALKSQIIEERQKQQEEITIKFDGGTL